MKLLFESSELTSEKSLWDVYLLTRRIKPSLVHIAILSLTTVALVLNALFASDQTLILLKSIREWASSGFNFSITTLGFLIAGFTIFVTVAKPDMMLAMMNHTDPETKIPTLKANLAKFMHVFIVYITFSSLYLAVILLGQGGGVISWLIQLAPDPLLLKNTVIFIAYLYIGISFVYLLLTLKSFIFNIYTIVMNFLRWEKDKPDDIKNEAIVKKLTECLKELASSAESTAK